MTLRLYRRMRSLTLLVLVALGLQAVAVAAPLAPGAQQRSPAAPQHAACTTPTSEVVRGKSVIFDQCIDRTFTNGSTTYRIHTYYTENAGNATNLAQCDSDENDAGRCEHALSNNDNPGGENVNAVLMSDQVQAAMVFYFARNLDFLDAGTTEFNIFVAEDPRGGGIVPPNSIYVDDDLIDSNDLIIKQLLAYHEIQHLVQDKYDDLVGWRDFYGEGISRAIEDRVDPTVDSDTGHLFIPQVDGILSNDALRTSDISTISYSSVLWWTWMMDQYRLGGESAPVLGWPALRDFYLELKNESDQLKAVSDFIASRGSTFRKDFTDYTLAMFASRFSPSDPRLAFLDSEINATAGLRGHSVINSGPAFSTSGVSMNPRSSRYWEFNPASQCAFIAFTFDGNGKAYSFSLMTVGGDVLQQRWSSYSTEWARTVRTSGLQRVAGVVTAFDNSGTVDVGRGCVTPTLNIKHPTSSAFEMVGTAAEPRKFIVRLDVNGADNSPIAGLTAADFQVQIRRNGTATLIPATIINSTYVQDDYWLLVQAPDSAAGALDGNFYDLVVSLGGSSDTELNALLYVERAQDVSIVLDRSGSMGGTTGRIEAARNAAYLMVNELSTSDQGGFVAFDTDADLRVSLTPIDDSSRTALENAIAAEVPLNWTSIGDGMLTAADDHDNKGRADSLCSFVLLSDGYENEPAYWADVRSSVVDNGCAIHSVGLGPSANEPLLQQIAAAAPGGSYDFADSSGTFPVGLSPQAAVGWQNNLSRIYDFKAAQIAGRQRIFSTSGTGREQVACDKLKPHYTFQVDETSDKLVLAIAWQSDSKATQEVLLFDPEGNPVDPSSARRLSPHGTNEVWEVKLPQKGLWGLCISNLPQEFYVSATALTDYEMYLFVGTPETGGSAGIQVPIFVTFAGRGGPLLGADVNASILAPNGSLHALHLYDDGDHGDSEPDDGVYANVYTVTGYGDLPATNPTEGEEPDQIGSYLVNAVGVRGELRREAQGSFALEFGRDDDQDRLPDGWEKTYGLDPAQTGEDDPDGDLLSNYCELQLGTDPLNSDTDAGGESDGSEAPQCTSGDLDPLDPRDDRVGPLTHAQAIPQATKQGPYIKVVLGAPLRGRFISAEIQRRLYWPDGTPAGDWSPIGIITQTMTFIDTKASTSLSQRYRGLPVIGGGAQLNQEPAFEATGAMFETNAAIASDDPYAPSGTILINAGDLTTINQVVTLQLSADDSGAESDGAPHDQELPAAPISALEMRISNSPDFSGVPWQPFQATVEGWDLGPRAPGEVAVVYVQFRDPNGNIGMSGFGQSDSITLLSGMYLPLVQR